MKEKTIQRRAKPHLLLMLFMIASANVIPFLADGRAHLQCAACFAQMQFRLPWAVYRKITFRLCARYVQKLAHIRASFVVGCSQSIGMTKIFFSQMRYYD